MNPSNDLEAQTGGNEGQLEDTIEKRLGNNNKIQSSAENYGDPSGKLWSMYLTEAKKKDGQVTNNWTEDTQGVLVFTGLFSSIIATFITSISLPPLSAGPNAQTVALLTQLVNNNGGVAGVPVPDSPPFEPPASIVRVNILWFLSLILSLSCALLATLMQQWARRYLGYALHSSAPRKQARIREFMFEGVEKFRMSQAVEAMPFLLHTSVFLFFAGLIEYLFTINNSVAHYTLGCVVVFAFIYAILTLLPNWRLNCPYRTPLSGITYYSLQFSGFSFLLAADGIESIFHRLLLRFHPHAGTPDHGPTKWREVLEEKVRTYYKRLKHSLRWRVVDSAMKAPSSVDVRALQWTLTTLDETSKIEEFAARMPGFFDSSAAPDANSAIHSSDSSTPPDATVAMLSLMSEQPTSGPILGFRLHELLNTCLPGSSLLPEDDRKSRLRVCLTSIWYCLRAYNLPENSGEPLAPYVRAIFASPEVIRWIQTEKDLAIRLLGRCFGSLVVKKLANDIDLRRTPTGISPPTTEESACLQSILCAPGEQVLGWLNRKGAIDLANVTFLASAELETLVDNGTNGVPAEVVDVFQQTLGVLAEGMFSSQADVEWNEDHMAQFHDIYFRLANAPVPDLLKERLRFILDRLPPISYMEEPEVVISRPEVYSETNPSHSTPQNRVDLVRTEGDPDSGYAEGIDSHIGSTATWDQ